MKPIPLMINSDAPTAGSGLGRICGDLARRIAENMPDIFRVCTFGYGGISSIHLPYHQYHIEGMGSDWVMPNLPDVWRDWAGDEKGVYLTINDLSRLGWLLRPKKQCENPILREFLLKKPFQIWTYLPTDAEGPNKKLTFPLQQILQGSDRILAYGKWGADVVDRTMGVVHDYNCSMVVRFATNMVLPDICTCGKGTQYLPHGIDTSVFRERDRTQDRKTFVSYTKSCTLMGNLADRVKSEEVLISIVATNQSRKDWALGIATVAKLSLTHNVRLWIKTDVAERHWSIPALLLDYGLADRTMITLSELTDEEMARAYSASDLVLGIAPEGFGYVHVESLSCGTPCIVGSYGGGAELVSPEMRVDPVAFRYESIWSCKRPVYNPADWAARAEKWLGQRVTMDSRYDWKVNWTGWDKWIREGVA